jgi:ADP-heptose:LPS heptosyltransferase
MGIGDDLIGTGLAKDAFAKFGKRVAFGNGQNIIWGPWSRLIFKNNPNVAPPGSERSENLLWMAYYKGCRVYNKSNGDRWIWNRNFAVKAGEIYFDDNDQTFDQLDFDFVLIEPNVPKKLGTINKAWNFNNYQALVDRLPATRFVQCDYGGRLLKNVTTIKTTNFREACSVLRKARLAILPEGGMHHAAAALEVRAIVLFGSWADPAVLGYPQHINITGGAKEFCGSFKECDHCIETLQSISVDSVLRHVA